MDSLLIQSVDQSQILSQDTTPHTHKHRRSDNIFSIFPDLPYQIQTCNLADVDPTNTFLPSLISIKDRAIFPLSPVLGHPARQEKPECRPTTIQQSLHDFFNFYLVDLQL